YAPNLGARNLASAEHQRIGLLFANPSAAYLTEFIVGLLDAMSRRGAELTLSRVDAGNAADERRVVRELLQSSMTGLLLAPPLSESATVRAEAAAAGIPVVAVATGRFPGDVSSVRIDDRKAAYDLTHKLINLGHRRIALIKGHPNQTASAERQAGYEAALRAFAPKAKPIIVQGFFSYQSGLLAAEQLLGGKTKPTAIFASNDDMAAAVVSVAHRRGLDVPRDISVAAFDDTAIATRLWPELTTVRQPIGEMAAAAVDLLLSEISARRDGETPAPVDIVMPYTLIERQSTAEHHDGES